MSKVSVILTSHDRFPLLRHAVASVLGQGLGVELVIVDDDSTDPRIGRFLIDISGAVSVIMLGPTKSGVREGCEMVGHSVNAGLDAASGEYISLLCDDDAYLPGRCEAYARFLDGHPNVDVVVGKNWWLTFDGRRLPHGHLPGYTYKKPLEPGHEGLTRALGPPNYICHDSVMFRRTGLRWDPGLEHTPVDWRFWCKLFREGARFARIDVYGEEAYIPGTWTNADVEEAAAARKLGDTAMGDSVKYAVNGTPQIQIVRINHGQRIQEVHPGEEIDAALVTSNGQMFPGFRPSRSVLVPALEKGPEPTGVLKGIPDIPRVEGSLLSSPYAEGVDAVHKTPFSVVELVKAEDVSPIVPGEEEGVD